jgi:arabinogalactan endo-1,4-beta-galactosidase
MIKLPLRLCLAISFLAVTGLINISCQNSLLPPTASAPVVPPVSPRVTEPVKEKKAVASERFTEGIDGWKGIADEGALSQVTWLDEARLSWTTQGGPDQFAGLLHDWPELEAADGLTLALNSVDRNAMLVLGVLEADGSFYCLVIPAEKGRDAEYTVRFEGFGLQPDTEDENGQLDVDQLKTLVLVDISSTIMAPSPNQVIINEITLWQGTPGAPYFNCDGLKNDNQPRKFRIGVDANFIPQAERANYGFWVDQQRVDPLELFAVNGADSFRLRLWVGEDGDSKLNYATQLSRHCQEAGLKPYLVLFLSDSWADVNKQPAPLEWAELPIEERAGAIRQYSFKTARHFLDRGIDLDFYEIGNEIDYGICGVFADVTHPRDVSSLKNDIWPDEARLIKAAIEGVKQADPGAGILLHIASGWDPSFALAFFEAMRDFGVDYDYMGLSYYPTAFGMAATSRVCETMNRLSAGIGKPMIIAETAYPSEIPEGGQFESWRDAIPGYPLTPEGQARWLADMLEGMRNRGDVAGVYLFSPDFWFSGELWEPFALFDNMGRAKPGLGALRTGE